MNVMLFLVAPCCGFTWPIIAISKIKIQSNKLCSCLFISVKTKKMTKIFFVEKIFWGRFKSYRILSVQNDGGKGERCPMNKM